MTNKTGKEMPSKKRLINSILYTIFTFPFLKPDQGGNLRDPL